MFTASPSSHTLRPVLAALLALAGGAFASSAPAATTTIQVPHALPSDHISVAPYNFSGRIFIIDANAGFGTGTLLRRHTVVTAGHVVYQPETGFIANATFTRALYKSFSLSTDQIISVTALSGYQTVAPPADGFTDAGAALDQGYVLLHNAPVDENWGNYHTQPSLLTSPATHLFVLGYPGATTDATLPLFDGLTPAYIVPTASYTPLGTSLTTGSYVNTSYVAEAGMSGGPIYYVQNPASRDPSDQFVAATLVGGNSDLTGQFTSQFVRAIDKAANKALVDAEYSSGLIKKVKITGPKTVARGGTYTYNTNVVFAVPAANGTKTTTSRYAELKLKNAATDSATNPAVVITKTSNTTFSVRFTTAARPNTQVVLQVFYERGLMPMGNSAITIQVQ